MNRGVFWGGHGTWILGGVYSADFVTFWFGILDFVGILLLGFLGCRVVLGLLECLCCVI